VPASFPPVPPAAALPPPDPPGSSSEPVDPHAIAPAANIAQTPESTGWKLFIALLLLDDTFVPETSVPTEHAIDYDIVGPCVAQEPIPVRSPQ
jgi:hypothetical protein